MRRHLELAGWSVVGGLVAFFAGRWMVTHLL